VITALLIALAAQGQDPGALFVVGKVETAGAVERKVVTADRRAVPCLLALRLLADAMDWHINIDSKPLESDLRSQAIDLDFADQDARVAGQLIAVAAGADMVFDAGNIDAGVRPTMHVTRKPESVTESGRNRLRGLAGQWYRSFLVNDLRHEPLVATEANRVRMNLGRLLVESGDLEAALPVFAEVYDNRPGDLVPAAVLRLSQTNLEFADGQRDSAVALKGYEKAEEWARNLLAHHPSAPEAAGATVALGRSMLGQARLAVDPQKRLDLCDRCRSELAARVMRLIDSVEMLDVWLVVGEAQFQLDWPTRAYETMLTLRESRNFDDLSQRQFRDYHFLLGYGALGSDKPSIAMQSLEWFLIHADGDRRTGMANVLMTDAYMRLGQHLQAHAAAVLVRKEFLSELPPAWRTRALEQWARTALTLGDKEPAFQELELLIHRENNPHLTLFLTEQLITDQQWQRAISVAKLLVNSDGDAADQARYKTVRALYQQAKAGKSFADFPTQARELAVRIQSIEMRGKCAELIGDAYTDLGQLETAADAYRGILR
jgi:hypothetical protein